MLEEIKCKVTECVVRATDAVLGERWLYVEGFPQMLFTENETNTERIFGVPNRNSFVKDSINDYVVLGKKDALNPANQGTKVSAHYQLPIGPGQRQVIRLRFTDDGPDVFAKASTNDGGPIGPEFQEVFASRRREADEFYVTVIPASLNADAASVMRQGWRVCYGPNSFTTTTWTDGWKNEAPTLSNRRARFPRAMTSGTTCTTGK